MLDSKPQPSLAVATAEMLWACAFAAARLTDAFAARGLALWSQMLRPPGGQSLQPIFPGLFPPPWFAIPPEANPPPPASAEPPAEPSFASYRSSGGHAAAQVVQPR